jgi:hypothetical protein
MQALTFGIATFHHLLKILSSGVEISMKNGHFDLEDEKPRRCLEKLGTNHPGTWRDIPKQQRLQSCIDYDVHLFLSRLRVEL